MNVMSVKRALGLAASAVAATGMMMLAPAAANAATAHPAHMQTVSNVSKASAIMPGSGQYEPSQYQEPRESCIICLPPSIGISICPP
jgi:phosphate-selective porin